MERLPNPGSSAITLLATAIIIDDFYEVTGATLGPQPRGGRGEETKSEKISTIKTERPPPFGQNLAENKGGSFRCGRCPFLDLASESDLEPIITSFTGLPTPRQLSDTNLRSPKIRAPENKGGSFSKGGGRSVLIVLIRISDYPIFLRASEHFGGQNPTVQYISIAAGLRGGGRSVLIVLIVKLLKHISD